MKTFNGFIILSFLLSALVTAGFTTGPVFAGDNSPGKSANRETPGAAAYYVKKDTWAETLLASRECHAAWWTKELDGVHPGPWHMTVPADMGKDIFKTEKSASLTKVDFEVRDGKGKRLWEARPDLLDGF